jgi:uncharacterized protein (DUF1330 family)
MESLMAAYVIGRVTKNHDPAWVAEYLEKIEPLFLRHGAKVLCRSFAVEKLEGTASPPAAVVLIEFPSAEHARAWYQDQEYAPLIRLRQSGSETEIELLDGTA